MSNNNKTVFSTDWFEIHESVGENCDAKFVVTAKNGYIVLRKQDNIECKKLFLIDKSMFTIHGYGISELLKYAKEITLFNLYGVDVDSKDLSNVIKSLEVVDRKVFD